MRSLNAEQIRERLSAALAADAHTKDYSSADIEGIVSHCSEHGARLTLDWQNVSRNEIHKKKPHYDPALLDVACTLAHYGLAETDFRPKRIEKRHDPLTGVMNEIGLGCICFVRGVAQ
jgi:hypothetical protein